MNAQDDFKSERDISKHQFSAGTDTFPEPTDICEDKVVKRKPQRKSPRKPQFSYIALIAMAISDSPERRRNLGDIIEYIKAKFPFYRRDCPVKGWRNSIRHNLSLNDCFIKTGRDPDQPSRGHLWTLHPLSTDMFEGGSFRRRIKRFNSPDAQFKEGSKFPSELLHSKAFIRGMKPLIRRESAERPNLLTVLTPQNQLNRGSYCPVLPQQLRQSLTSGPVMSCPMLETADICTPRYVPLIGALSGHPDQSQCPVRETTDVCTPCYVPFRGTLSRHPEQAQYLFWSQTIGIRNEVAHLRYECPQCAGCTCDY